MTVRNMVASLYEPINTYKPVAANIGIVDVSFPKITSVQIRAVQQNQRMIQRDARGPDSDWSACRQTVQVAAPT
jgi:hypothetical protein